MGYKTQLKTYFETGDQPTAKQWGSLIDNNINTREIEKNQVLRGPLYLSSGSTDFFHQIAPPFVPNLHPHIKVFTFDNHTAINANVVKDITWNETGSTGDTPSAHGTIDTSDANTSQNAQTGYYIWEKRTFPYVKRDRYGTINRGFHATCSIMSGALSSSTDSDHRSNLPYGGFVLETANARDLLSVEGAEHALFTASGSFSCLQGKPFWAKTRFYCSSSHGTEFGFGFTENNIGNFSNVSEIHKQAHSTTVANTRERIMIAKTKWQHQAVTFGVSSGSAGTSGSNEQPFDTAQTYKDPRDIVSYGIYWDGILDSNNTGSIRFYANKVAHGATPGPMALVHTYTGSVPWERKLRLFLSLTNRSTRGSSSMAVEYLQAAILTDR